MPKSRKKAHRHVFTHGSELKDVSILLYFLQMLLLPNVKVPGCPVASVVLGVRVSTTALPYEQLQTPGS
jgi:hypothetical protein